MESSSIRPVWVYPFLSSQLTSNYWNLRNLTVKKFPVFPPVISAVMNQLLMGHFVKTLPKGFRPIYFHCAVVMRLSPHAQSECRSPLEEFEKASSPAPVRNVLTRTDNIHLDQTQGQ